MTEYLLNTARPFIFSTALPPPVVAAASAALELLVERPKRVEKLAANADALREALATEGLDVGDSRTQIVPVIVGGAKRAVALCEAALGRGVFAQAIRPPTVPEGTSRLRLTAIATHKVGDLRRAAKLISESARELGLIRDPSRPRPVPGPRPAIPQRDEAGRADEREPQQLPRAA